MQREELQWRLGKRVRELRLKRGWTQDVFADKSGFQILNAWGRLTPQEGETMMRILESDGRVLEKIDFEQRLEKLEREAVRQESSL